MGNHTAEGTDDGDALLDRGDAFVKRQRISEIEASFQKLTVWKFPVVLI